MTEMKISLPEKLIEIMKKHPETNWEKIVSNAVEVYLNTIGVQKTTDQLEDLKNEIERSKRILELDDGWDGLESKGYQKETWEKMCNFLMDLATKFNNKNDLIIHTPYINPGSNGAIDLHWQSDKFELLLSIPKSDDIAINYYGDNYGRSRIKGTLEEDDLEIILTFMKMYH